MIKTLLLHPIWTSFLIIFYFLNLSSVPFQNLFTTHFENPRSSIPGIDGVYVINLDVRPERWHRPEPVRQCPPGRNR